MSHSRQPGMTLIEVLAALAILSATVTAALTITRGTGQAVAHAERQREALAVLAWVDVEGLVSEGKTQLDLPDDPSWRIRIEPAIEQDASDARRLTWYTVTVSHVSAATNERVDVLSVVRAFEESDP